MHGHLRVVGARLHAQVAVDAGRVEVVAGEVRQLAQRRRPPAGEPEAVLAVGSANRPGPKPKVMREPRGRQAEGLAGVLRRRVVRAVHGADSPTARPPVIRAAAAVHVCSSATRSSRGRW